MDIVPNRFKLIAAIALIAVALAVSTAGIIVYLFYPSALTAQIEGWAKDNIGRTLTTNGSAHVNLWPEAVIILEEVSLSAPDNMARAPLMSAKELHIKTSLSAILGKRLEIASISVIEPEFNVVTDSSGTANWMLEKAGDLPAISLENGSLSYLDERTGHTATAVELDAIVRANAQDRTVDIDGSFIWNRQPVKLTAYVRAPERLLTEGSPASIALRAPQLTANFDGRLRFEKGIGLAGQLRLYTDDFPVMASWAGINALSRLGIKTLSMSGSTDISHRRATISRTELRVNGSEAIGDVSLEFVSDSAPILHASIVTDAVDFDSFLSGDFDFGDLKHIPANLRIAAKKWSVGPIKAGAADFYAKIENGILQAKSTDIEIYGGTASLEATLDGTQRFPSFKLAVNGTGLDSRSLLAACLGHAAATGIADVSADLAASGRSLAEFVSTLGGKIKFSARNGAINGPDLPRLLTDVSRNMVEGWRNGMTPFDEFTATFNLRDGIAETVDLQLAGKDVSLTGKGEADLLRRAIEFKIDPKFSAGATVASLPVPVVVKGSWYKPKFYPDMPGILENPDAAYKALKELGAPAAEAH
jgi:uncharacterized protein involved in outer membrane biogenesis